MKKSDNYYWYKENPSQSRLIIGRLLVPSAFLLVIIFYGFQPVLSESNNEINPDSSGSSNNISGSEKAASSNNEGYLSKDSEDGSNGENSVSISDNEVSVRIDESSRATVGQTDSNISISINNSSSSQSENPADTTDQPTLVINGEDVNIPKNGRVSQVIKDDNSTTRLRTDIDGDGSSSIRIDSSSN